MLFLLGVSETSRVFDRRLTRTVEMLLVCRLFENLDIDYVTDLSSVLLARGVPTRSTVCSFLLFSRRLWVSTVLATLLEVTNSWLLGVSASAILLNRVLLNRLMGTLFRLTCLTVLDVCRSTGRGRLVRTSWIVLADSRTRVQMTAVQVLACRSLRTTVPSECIILVGGGTDGWLGRLSLLSRVVSCVANSVVAILRFDMLIVRSVMALLLSR